MLFICLPTKREPHPSLKEMLAIEEFLEAVTSRDQRAIRSTRKIEPREQSANAYASAGAERLIRCSL